MFKSKIDEKIDAEILSALAKLDGQDLRSDEYGAIIERISELKKLKSENKGLKPPSLDTVLVVGANIFGILWLAHFEREGNVIKTPNAFKFVPKPR